jgi:predicted PurR-regulated permease PerM
MPENETPADHWMPSRIARGIVVAAAVVIVLAGMRAASSILVPFLVSAFVALICIPPLLWLQKKGLPSWAAVLVVIFALLGGASMVGTLVGTSLTEFYRALPSYQARFLQLTIEVEADMLEWGWNIPDGMLTDVFSPGAVMRTAASVLSALSGLLTNAFVILLTVLFVLAEASSLPRKLRASMADPVASFSHIEEITRNVNQYLAIKTLISHHGCRRNDLA